MDQPAKQIVIRGLMASVAIVCVTVFYKGNFTGRSIAEILQQTGVPKIVAIILIILSASFLGLLRVIAGEAVIALLSGIAGYVLGNQMAKREPKDSAAE